MSVTCDRSVDFSGHSNFRHKSSNWKNLQWTNDGSKVVHNIKHLWVIMWHIFTSTNNTTTIVFPSQLWELLYTYHVIKQCTEKETTSLSNFILTIKLNYLHDLKIMFQYLLHCILICTCTCRYGWILISCLNWKLQLFMCFWIIK